MKKKHMPDVVEFVGAGGSGKSHVCREILRKEMNSGSQDIIIANHYKVSLFDILGYSVSHLQNLFQIILLVGKLRGVSIIRRALRFNAIIIYLVRRDYLFLNKKIILFDQGIIQMLRVLERKTDGAVAVRNLSQSQQKLFFDELDKLVIVEADSEKIINRRISRDKTRFPDQESISAEMISISNSMKKTHKDAKFVKKEWNVNVFTYFNNSDGGLNKVYDFVRSAIHIFFCTYIG